MGSATDRNTKLSAVVAFLVLASLGGLIGQLIRSFYATNASVVHTQTVVIALKDFLSAMKDVEAGAQGFALTGSQSFFETHGAGVNLAKEKLRELRTLTLDSRNQQRRLTEIEPFAMEKFALAEEWIDVRRRGALDLTKIPQQFDAGLRSMSRLREWVAEMEAEETGLLKIRLSETYRAARGTFILLGGGLVLIGLLLAAVFYLMRRDLQERERSSRLLQSSAEQVKDLYNRAPCGYHSLDAQGIFLEMNDTELSWLGYSREEVIGRLSFTDLISQKEKEQFQINYPRFQQRGWLRNREYELRAKGGRIVPVLINSDAVRDKDGGFVYTRSSVVDITERKRSEEATEVARAYAENIVDTVREPLVILTQEMCVKSANRSFYELFGIDRSNTEGHHLRELADGQWAVPELLHALEAASPAQDPLNDFELTLEFPKIGQRVFQLSARRLSRTGSESALILLAMEDVTERKQNERIHLQFRALFESLPGLYAVLSTDLTIVAASDAYLNATMSQREEVRGRTPFEVFPNNPAEPGANGPNNVRASLHRVVQHGAADTMAIQRYDMKRSDGTFEERYWSIVNSPIFGADRNLEYIIHRVEDVTEFVAQKQLVGAQSNGTAQVLIREEQMEAEVFQRTQEIQLMNEQLRTANEELEAFSYSVSHDLRAPLRHIDGFADMLKSHAAGSLDDKARRYLATISEAAKRMGQLIDDLLVFSRVGRLEMRRGHVNLSALVSEVRQMLENESKDRIVVWKVGPLPTVRGDLPMLRQAMANLLSNALKYTRRKPEALIEVGTLSRQPGEAVIFIRDNGAGFDMKYAAKLFGVFQRLHGAAEFEGTGVGLAIVRRVVQRHGGQIWAEGRINAGAVFYLTLPIENEAQSESPA